MQLESLCSPADPGISAEVIEGRCQCVTQTVAGHHDKYVAHAFKTVTEVRVNRQVVRKSNPGEVANVLTVRDHGFEQVDLDNATEPNIATGTRKLQSQRRSPGTRTDDGNCL
jgi:hypothetical protein